MVPLRACRAGGADFALHTLDTLRASRAYVTLKTLRARGASWAGSTRWASITLQSLRTGGANDSLHTLNALRTLRTSGAYIALWASGAH